MKRHLFLIIYTFVLVLASILTVLSTFVIAKEKNDVTVLEPTIIETEEIIEEKGKFFINDKGNKCYKDSNISIEIITFRELETEIYLADIKVNNPKLLKTYLAKNTFGLNIKEKPSAMAKKVNAILAINGDYYGFREKGYVIRNGILYDSNRLPRNNTSDILVVNDDGSFSVKKESAQTSVSLFENKAWQVFCFGPGLLVNGEVVVDEKSEVGGHKASNPRTAIGMIEIGHYVMMVSDGRTPESAGLSLFQLANILKDYGVKEAYNLDGGGSSVMIFNNEIINKPTSDGESIRERSSSDIVYIGY